MGAREEIFQSVASTRASVSEQLITRLGREVLRRISRPIIDESRTYWKHRCNSAFRSLRGSALINIWNRQSIERDVAFIETRQAPIESRAFSWEYDYTNKATNTMARVPSHRNLAVQTRLPTVAMFHCLQCFRRTTHWKIAVGDQSFTAKLAI